MSLHWERQAIHNSWFLIPKRSQWFVLKFISVLCRGRAEFSSEFCHYDGAFWRKTSYPFCFDSHWLMHFKQRDTNICHNFKEGGRSTSVYLPGSYVCACNLNIASEWWYIRSYLLSTLFKKMSRSLCSSTCYLKKRTFFKWVLCPRNTAHSLRCTSYTPANTAMIKAHQSYSKC